MKKTMSVVVRVLAFLMLAGSLIQAQNSTTTVENLLQQEKAKLEKISQELEALWPQKDCAVLVTRHNMYPLVSLACKQGYSAEERDVFLDFLFKNGFRLHDEEYSLKEKNGLYLYKTSHEIETENFIFFKLYFRDAAFLWPKTPSKLGKLAIFINEVSHVKNVIHWQALGIPLSYGILPFTAETGLVAQKIDEYKQEKWLSLSLEPLKLLPTMGRVLTIKDALEPDRVQEFIEAGLDSIMPVKGVATRFGALFAQNVYAMRAVLTPLQEKHIELFLDNTQMKNSVAYETAQIMSFKSFQSIMTLDANAVNIAKQWQASLESVKKNGSAIIVINGNNVAAFEFLKKAIKSQQGLLLDYHFVSEM